MNLKRTLIGLAVAGSVFAGVYGLAASMGVNSDSLGAGNSAVVACQAGTVSVAYGSAYSATGPAGYRATTVTLGNLDTTSGACGGKAYRVTLTGPAGSNASLAEQTATLPSIGANTNITFTGVSASDITGVHVVFAG